MRRTIGIVTAAFLIAGCPQDIQFRNPPPSRAPDATGDAGTMDAMVSDLGFRDAEPPDLDFMDADPADEGFPDAEPADLGPMDAEPPDLGFRDADPPDLGFMDADPPDEGFRDADPPDGGLDPNLAVPPHSNQACTWPGSASCGGPRGCRFWSPHEGRCSGCSPCNLVGDPCVRDDDCDIIFACYRGFCTNYCLRSSGCGGIPADCIDVGHPDWGVCRL